jgi:transketolase
MTSETDTTSTTDTPATDHSTAWGQLARQLRVDSIRCTAAAGSGHPTSALSAAELMAVLIADHLRYDPSAPHSAANDHLVFSKGHASPLVYAILRAMGAISEEELLTYRKHGSRLEGHPTPRLPWIDVATGSLGQGLPIGVGIALAAKRLEHSSVRTWVLAGDSEMAEGSMWEAIAHAADAGLDTLTLVIDVNRLGQTGPTRWGHDLDAYAKRLRAFGWDAIEIDGHQVDQIDAAYREATSTTDRPTAIVARTLKGKGVAEVEDKVGAHGKVIDEADEAIRQLGGASDIRVTPPRPDGRGTAPADQPASGELELPRYELGQKVATRKAFGEALVAVGRHRSNVVALDGEVGNSTYTELFEKALPDRFLQMYIAEQQMVATAVGLQVRGWHPFAATFAAFLTRALDFIRMAAVSRATISLSGSHAGVSIGEDGPSQMGLEDLAMMRAVHGSAVLYPSDANQTARLTAAMADYDGISYLRTTRAETPVIYEPDEEFTIGGSRTVRSSANDQLAIVAAGITLHQALKAADVLADDGLRARVIDLYSVKPLDQATLQQAARDTGRILTVEDHWPQGGIGEAVAAALASTPVDGDPPPLVHSLAVTDMPLSGTPDELMRAAGIDSDAIAAAARALVENEVVIVSSRP